MGLIMVLLITVGSSFAVSVLLLLFLRFFLKDVWDSLPGLWAIYMNPAKEESERKVLEKKKQDGVDENVRQTEEELKRE